MARTRNQSGFSMIELIFVVVIALILAAFAVPWFTETMRNFRIAGDARDINGEILLAKMRAAANFTAARVHFDTSAKTFVSEMWNKTSNSWVPVSVGGPQPLSKNVSFGPGSVTQDPNGAAIASPATPACRSGTGATWVPGGNADVANSACIVFNSRGFPVNNSGTPTPGVVFINDGTTVQAITISGAGLTATWRAMSATQWFRH